MYRSTENMIADMMTKPLGRKKFTQLGEQYGLKECNVLQDSTLGRVLEILLLTVDCRSQTWSHETMKL